MPSSMQRAPGSGPVAITLQDCDPTRGDQQFVPGNNASSAGLASTTIQSAYGGICLTSLLSGGVNATLCNDSDASQLWSIRQDSNFWVVESAANASTCLAATPGSTVPTTSACVYNGSLPPPFELNIGDQLWVWDAFGEGQRGAGHQAV